MTTHVFAESLELSRSYADAPWWLEVYREAFPNLASCVYIARDGWAQRGGIDRVLTMHDGTTVTVDEKVRTRSWDDFALETWSDKQRKKPGWMQKELACDFLAYAFVPDAECYLLPFKTLRLAWLRFGAEWFALGRASRDGFRIIEAKNNGYVTESLCVPRPVLLDALIDAMKVTWRAT